MDTSIFSCLKNRVCQTVWPTSAALVASSEGLRDLPVYFVAFVQILLVRKVTNLNITAVLSNPVHLVQEKSSNGDGTWPILKGVVQ